MCLRLVFFIVLPVLAGAQTFSEGRFIAKNNTLLWTEKFEIKDMDEPIIVATIKEQLSAKESIQLDTLLEHEVVSGYLIPSPSASIISARFRIDILYERYIVTVSEIAEITQSGEAKLETTFLDSKGSFNKNLLQRLDKLDSLLMALFEIKQ
ncbi:hypothetical protein [Runella slithyformis]|uniref:DUF4468 domain-containing protein n=1 Tax=Runella slithyformis (strain ATCC 29530 / DSM 19594 / LMG 11500 / NCIMB 11436 / LSU 4) TaxID=761193 RepID=A0A7U4E8H6_RUNSL|nr:hypothetical protein [Runella slithyformis]AEI51459.1 hypothetical protein Runsl_5159 [Runella slithyformis DSM 19594]